MQTQIKRNSCSFTKLLIAYNGIYGRGIFSKLLKLEVFDRYNNKERL